MSFNFSIENNSSQWKNYTFYSYYSYVDYFMNLLIVNVTFAVAGTLINVWFLAAMLLDRKIRSRMRNKIICGLLVVNLTETVILCGLDIIDSSAVLLEANQFHCNVYAVYETIYHTQDFVGNWYLVILLCVFTTRSMKFEPRFTPRWKNILTSVIFISPCVFALFFVPLTMNRYYSRFHDAICLSASKAKLIYICLDTIVPQTLAVLLLMIASAFKRRRYFQGPASDALRDQLIDDRSQIDPWYPFVALLVTAIATDIFKVVYFINPRVFYMLEHWTMNRLFLVFQVVTYLRLVVVPLVILLFPDIREQIKTWRPCRRSVPPTDLVVTYEKNTS
ncbi:unnamed protein product [Candidula unifasciata]|uniref:Uncharacterized protein n=1 Tax=Candidula unifasciata TaxID=100452 RepID=A0A8S4A5J4_9EUPU|nr:unnamed protein product [Candidula unifasciata]